jgi:hypothetical protein
MDVAKMLGTIGQIIQVINNFFKPTIVISIIDLKI